VECNFVKPIYVGDMIEVLVWDVDDDNNDDDINGDTVEQKEGGSTSMLRFEVHRRLASSASTAVVAVKDGLVEVKWSVTNDNADGISKL